MYLKYYKFKPLVLSLSSGLLLACGWYKWSAWLIMFALVPLLWLLDDYLRQAKWTVIFKIWFYVWLGFSVWNAITLWWIWEASSWVSLVAWFANALLQTLPIILAFLLIRSYRKFNHLIFLLAWMSFEYVHLHWELSWPWLNLGNVLMFFPKVAQWYEFTGTFGGTLWILILNLALVNLLKKPKQQSSLIFITVLVLPIMVSLWIYYTYEEKGKTVEIIVVQPNIDCYTEKFDYNVKTGQKNFHPIPYLEQVQRYMDISKPYLNSKTRFLLFPETALHRNKNEANLHHDTDILRLQDLIKTYPKLAILTGMQSYIIYSQKPDNYTYRYSETIGYYDYFNSACSIKKDSLQIYHKSKLVLGVETMPFKKYLGTLLYLGGLGGSLGTQVDRTIFNNQGQAIAPIICYESIYGEFVTEYTTKGASILGVITNDGWWGDTPGHRQHLAFSALRAIENRRPLARAANTGISAFFDQRGELNQHLPYNQLGALRQQVLGNSKTTFYMRYGDYLARIAFYLLLILVIIRIADLNWLRLKNIPNKVIIF